MSQVKLLTELGVSNPTTSSTSKYTIATQNVGGTTTKVKSVYSRYYIDSDTGTFYDATKGAGNSQATDGNHPIIDAMDIEWAPYKITYWNGDETKGYLRTTGDLISYLSDMSSHLSNISGSLSGNFIKSISISGGTLTGTTGSFSNSKSSNVINQSQGTKQQTITNIYLDSTGKLTYIYADSIGARYFSSSAYHGEIFNNYSGNSALGTNSHAEGSGTSAEGENSHSEGYNTKAQGNSSHAEGYSATASGTYGAHSEGYGTKASGSQGAHAEGVNNIASGNYGSHAEGCQTVAAGENTHSEGWRTYAIDKSSHAEGVGAALSLGSTFQYAAESTTVFITSDALSTINVSRIVGMLCEIGNNSIKCITAISSETTKTNTSGTSVAGYDLTLDGTFSNSNINYNYIWVYGLANGSGAHSEGFCTYAYSPYTHAEGNRSRATSSHAHAEGNATIASGTGSHVEGNWSIASNNYAHAEGESTTASGVNSHAEGRGTTARSKDSHAEGRNCVAGPSNTENSDNYPNHAEGQYTHAEGAYGSHSEGYYTKATGWMSHVEGECTYGYSRGSHAEGYNTKSGTSSSTNNSNYVSHAEGWKTTASGPYGSHAEGRYTTASGDGSHSEGYSETQNYIVAAYIGAHAEGRAETNCKILAYERGTHVEGYAGANNKVYNIVAAGVGAHAEGWASEGAIYAEGWGSHAEGCSTYTLAKGAHAEGISTRAAGEASHSEGAATWATNTRSHAEGYSTLSAGNASHSEGDETFANNQGAHAEGQFSVAAGVASHSEGQGWQSVKVYGDISSTDTTFYLESDSNSLVFDRLVAGRYLYCGSAATANKWQKITEIGDADTYTNSSGTKINIVEVTIEYTFGITISSGSILYLPNVASGFASHAEGEYTVSTGQASHAEGFGTRSTNLGSHSEGKYTEATGQASHAEGYGTRSTNLGSHAEGENTEATGEASHAEGYGGNSSGAYSHVEGYYGVSSGQASHTSGWYGSATSNYSFAHGYYVYATKTDNEVVFGKYNEDLANSIFEIGIGTGIATRQRKNAITLFNDSGAVTNTKVSPLNGRMFLYNTSNFPALTASDSTKVCTNINADKWDGYHNVIESGAHTGSSSDTIYFVTDGTGSVGSTTITWTNLSGKISSDCEFNIVSAGFSNTNFWFNYLPIDNRSSTASITNYYMGNGNKSTANVYATSFNSTSDITLKNVIENIQVSIEDISKLPIFKFTWIDKQDDLIHIGTSAQAVEEIIPELVHGEETKSLDYSTLGVIAGIENSKEIIKLKDEVNTLKEENKDLRKEIEELKELVKTLINND